MWYSYFLSRLRKQICSDAMPAKYMIWLFQLSCANKSKNGLSSVCDEVGNLTGIRVPWKPAAIQIFLGNLNQVAELRKKILQPWFEAQRTQNIHTLGYGKMQHLASQEVLVVKNPSAKAGVITDIGSIPGSGIYPRGGHGNSLQYSCRKNPKDRESWWATAHRVGHDWNDLAQTS